LIGLTKKAKMGKFSTEQSKKFNIPRAASICRSGYLSSLCIASLPDCCGYGIAFDELASVQDKPVLIPPCPFDNRAL